MTNARVTQLLTEAAVSGGSSVRATLLATLVAAQYPAIEMRGTSLLVEAAVQYTMDIRVTQLVVLAAVRGRVGNPRIRVWWFSQDAHDFCIVHLGADDTVVFDLHTGEWHDWGSGNFNFWKAFTGTAWEGGRKFAPNWSNVVCGDETRGTLYFLSPDDDYDDDAGEGADYPRPFTRIATGQVIVKPGYRSVPCFGVHLFGSIGSGDDDLTVNLQVSDDRGNTYDDMGDITLDSEDYTARVNWPSLGSMNAPGRLFRITDTGALKRIDSLEMD